MRQWPSLPIILRFAIGAFIAWQVYRAQTASDAANPLTAADDVSRAVMYIFLGTFAILALNLLYPAVAWGIGLRRRAGLPVVWTPAALTRRSQAPRPGTCAVPRVR